MESQILKPLRGVAKVESLVDVLARPGDLPYVDTFRIATYNVHNLFGADKPAGCPRSGPPASEEQKAALGQMICSLDADAIAFQEVQDEKVLKELFVERVNPYLRKAKQPLFSTFVCIPANDPRGINVALATRLAVRATVTFHDYEFGPQDGRTMQFSRDLLGVEIFATPEYKFLFFIAHLKSKLGGATAEEKRLYQASEIRTLLEEPISEGIRYIDQDLILAGDMNDDPAAETISTLCGTDQNTVLHDILAASKPDYTYPTHNRYKKTRLDYIFASPSMARKIKGFRIHRDSPAAVASDHYPVSVTINPQSAM